MKRAIVLILAFATSAAAMNNEDLKKKPPRVVFDSPRSMAGALSCFDEGTDIWVRYFGSPDHRVYRKADSVDIEYLTAPVTIFAAQTRTVLASIHGTPAGSHIELWGAPAVDALDPAGAASRGHGAIHAKEGGRFQQSIDSFKLCLASNDPAPPGAAMVAAAPQMSIADELTKLADLKAKGIISPAEFDAQKAKLLAAH